MGILSIFKKTTMTEEQLFKEIEKTTVIMCNLKIRVGVKNLYLANLNSLYPKKNVESEFSAVLINSDNNELHFIRRINECLEIPQGICGGVFMVKIHDVIPIAKIGIIKSKVVYPEKRD